MILRVTNKIFSFERIVPSFFLNIFGLQVFRYILAKLIYNFRYSNFKKNKISQEVKSRGYSQIDNFLDKDEFGLVKLEFDKIISSELSSNIQNEGTIYLSCKIDDTFEKNFPNIFKLFKNSKIRENFESCEGKKNIEVYCRLERIYLNDSSIEDITKNYHYDTFHNTFKAWLYLTDVKLENGPLVIIPGSSLFSLRRLLFEFIESIKFSFLRLIGKIKDYRNGDKNVFSSKNYQYFRIANSKKILFDRVAKNFICNKNTLVFVNTHALHRRGDAVVGKNRDSVHFYTRTNPFELRVIN